MCTEAHRIQMARYWYRRKQREGKPLSRYLKASLARDLADDNDRLAYRWRGPSDSGWLEEIITLPPARVILAWRKGGSL
jgi:hypothetical protein